MLSKQDNEFLSRVEGEAVTGKMMCQHHWVLVICAGRVQEGEARSACGSSARI
jgi:hypothetical protein